MIMTKLVTTLSSILLFSFCQAQVVIERMPTDEEAETNAETLGATQVNENDSFPEDQQAMMVVIDEWMTEKGDDTSEYYAIVDEENSTDEEIQVLMYHNTAFAIMTSGKKKGITLAGNPGGQCKTIYYDPVNGEVTNQRWWQ